MRWQTFVVPGLLACVTAGHVGCSSVSGRSFGFGPAATTAASATPPNATSSAASNGGAIQRVSYIEQRYREDFDPIKRPKAEGLDAFKPESLKAQVKDITGTGPNAKVARELFAESDGAEREDMRSQIAAYEAELSTLEDEIKILLLPRDANEGKSVIMEIRWAEGGEEATVDRVGDRDPMAAVRGEPAGQVARIAFGQKRPLIHEEPAFGARAPQNEDPGSGYVQSKGDGRPALGCRPNRGESGPGALAELVNSPEGGIT